jgi:hypothetical protein
LLRHKRVQSAGIKDASVLHTDGLPEAREELADALASIGVRPRASPGLARKSGGRRSPAAGGGRGSSKTGARSQLDHTAQMAPWCRDGMCCPRGCRHASRSGEPHAPCASPPIRRRSRTGLSRAPYPWVRRLRCRGADVRIPEASFRTARCQPPWSGASSAVAATRSRTGHDVWSDSCPRTRSRRPAIDADTRRHRSNTRH